MTSKKDTKQIESSYSDTVRGFIQNINGCWKSNLIQRKDDMLFNMSQMSGKKRTDVEYSCGILMDIDNGELTPEEFTKVLHEFSHITYNSLISILEDAGYTIERAGLDMSKSHPESFFFLPCTNKNQADMAFFLKHRCQTRQLERHCLNPLKVLANLPAEPTQLEPLYYEYVPANDEPKVKDPDYANRKLEDLKEQWRSFPTGLGQRYHGLFKLACAIGYYASDINEAQDILYELARDKKERDRIPGYIKSLQRYRL